MLRAFLLLLLLCPPVPALAAPPCQAGDAEAAEIASVDDRLELTLMDGRRILLAGIEPPLAGSGDAATGDARGKLEEWLGEPEILVRFLAAKPDRWGRLAALVFTPAGAQAQESLAHRLLRAGLARLRVTPPLACLESLRSEETSARDNGLGVWAQESSAMIAADDIKAFADKNGANIVVEGMVTAVNATEFRTYLNFGPRRYKDFSVTVLKPSLKIFDKAGLPLHSLSGHRIRVRGMLDLRFGPQIEVASPDAIELLD